METKNISLQEKRQDPNLVEVTIYGKPYFISKALLLSLEQAYLKEQKKKKKNVVFLDLMLPQKIL